MRNAQWEIPPWDVTAGFFPLLESAPLPAGWTRVDAKWRNLENRRALSSPNTSTGDASCRKTCKKKKGCFLTSLRQCCRKNYSSMGIFTIIRLLRHMPVYSLTKPVAATKTAVCLRHPALGVFFFFLSNWTPRLIRHLDDVFWSPSPSLIEPTSENPCKQKRYP